MVTYYNKKDLIKFGDFLLNSNKTGLNEKLVTHADLENWHHEEGKIMHSDEGHLLDQVNDMAISSMSPDQFKQWEILKKYLIETRGIV